VKLENRKGNIPNRFYFAAPKGIIDINELPEHCGLIENGEGIYNKCWQIKKTAPILHRENVINYKLLFERMYWRHRSLYIDMINKQNVIF